MLTYYGYLSDVFYNAETAIESFGSIISGLVYIVSIISGLASYIMLGLAVMMMGQKLNVKNPWLSWVPFADSYAFGRISETPDKPRKTRVSMLVLRILTIAFSVLTIVLAVVVIIMAVIYYNNGGNGFPASVAVFTVLMLLFLLGMIGVVIAYNIMYYMAFYRITRLFAGEKYMTYFLLGLIPSLLGIAVSTPIVMLVLASREPLSKVLQSQEPIQYWSSIPDADDNQQNNNTGL